MKSFKFLRNNNRPEFWLTARNGQIPIKQIGTNHIYNIIDCLNDRGFMRIPDIYESYTKSEWIHIMQSELNRRDNERL
jgi:hypothetical protein